MGNSLPEHMFKALYDYLHDGQENACQSHSASLLHALGLRHISRFSSALNALRSPVALNITALETSRASPHICQLSYVKLNPCYFLCQKPCYAGRRALDFL